MKKSLFTVLMLLVMLVSVAAEKTPGIALTLISVRNNSSGPTFVFFVTGDFSKRDLQGSVWVQGGDVYTLYCSQADEVTAVCHTSKKAGDSDVVITFGGSTFWTFVPAAHINQLCYKVYDWNVPDPTIDHWVDYGHICQEQPATDGELILFDTPVWPLSPYIYAPNGPDAAWCTWPNEGEGYYYPSCPD